MEMASSLNIVKSLQNKGFTTHCIDSTSEVFLSLFEAKVGLEKSSETDKSNHEISAVMSFMSDKIDAVVVLSCSRDTIVNLVKNNFGDALTENQSIFFLGEALNIIFGMLKEKLSFEGYQFDMCLPMVVTGQDHMVLNLLESEIVVQNYHTDFGNIALTIGTSPKKILSRVLKAQH